MTQTELWLESCSISRLRKQASRPPPPCDGAALSTGWSPQLQKVFSVMDLSFLSFQLREKSVISFQSYISNARVRVGDSLRNTGSRIPLLLLLGSQLLVSAELQCGASIFQFLDGTVHLYC